MSGRRSDRCRLDQARDRVTRWRQRYGGPGIPLPEAIWEEAVEVARTEGVSITARALRVDRLRLAARMDVDESPVSDGGPGPEASEDRAGGGGRFVEVDASRLCASPQRTVVRFQGRDGERLEVELGDATTIDVVAVAHAFWERSR